MTEDELDDTFHKLTKGENNTTVYWSLYDDHSEYPLLPEVVKVNGVSHWHIKELDCLIGLKKRGR